MRVVAIGDHRRHQHRGHERRAPGGHEGRHRRDRRPTRSKKKGNDVRDERRERPSSIDESGCRAAHRAARRREGLRDAAADACARCATSISTIEQGEFVAIVGTSGSGKSTMMNILGCLDRPTRGTYTLAGLDVGAAHERRARHRAQPAHRLHLPGLQPAAAHDGARERASCRSRTAAFARASGASARSRRSRRSGSADRVHHTPNQLSGGQQQRVAIARALVTEPPLLLADEPTGNLDTRTSLEVLALLQELNRERGITIVLVTHEPDIAACASRVVTFRDGRIVSDVVQDEPLDAAAELAALPPQQEYATGAPRTTPPIPSPPPARGSAARSPSLVYVAMVVGALLGALAGRALRASSSASTVPVDPARLRGRSRSTCFGARSRKAARRSAAHARSARARRALRTRRGSRCSSGRSSASGWMPWSKALLDRLEGLSSAALAGTLALIVALVRDDRAPALPRAGALRVARAETARAAGPSSLRPEESAMSLLLGAIRLAFCAIVRNKLRAALTVLGILIGVAAVVIVTALADGASASVGSGQIDSFGANVLFIYPQTTQQSGAREQDHRAGSPRTTAGDRARGGERRRRRAFCSPDGAGRLRRQERRTSIIGTTSTTSRSGSSRSRKGGGWTETRRALEDQGLRHRRDRREKLFGTEGDPDRAIRSASAASRTASSASSARAARRRSATIRTIAS